jgi:nucleoside phosphorylase
MNESERRLLIFVAFNEEFKAVKKILNFKSLKGEKKSSLVSGSLNGFGVDLIKTSIGMDLALKVATEKIDPEKHGGIFVLGFCGGLALTLKNSDIIVPNKIISSRDQSVFEVEGDLIEAMGRVIITVGQRYRAVPMITENKVIETRTEKEALYHLSHAEAVDMETSEILRVAELKKVKACVLKVVIDDCETELPHFNDIFKKTGKMDRLSVASAMMSSPGLSMQLSSNMKKASMVIDSILPQMIEKLCGWWQIPRTL